MSGILALLGVVAVLTAVTVLAGWPWALLVLGAVLIIASYVTHVDSPPPAAAAEEVTP